MGLVAGGRAELGWVGLWSSDLSTAGDMMVYDCSWGQTGEQGSVSAQAHGAQPPPPPPGASLQLPHLAVGSSALAAAGLGCRLLVDARGGTSWGAGESLQRHRVCSRL